jgi:hypothetical protein
MRPRKRTALIFLILGFCACKKVIDIKVKDSDSRYVIEGVITNEPGSCKVLLSQTQNFNEDNSFPQVSGAVVRVKDNGSEFILTETVPGVYQNTALKGTPGHTYQLSVTVNNQVFMASYTMPQPVPLDTLYISPGPFGQFKFATIGYTDPAGINNFYRFVQFLNGVKDPHIFWQDDEFTDGEKILIRLDTGVDKKDDPRSIKAGDQVTIELHSIDQAVYKYWYSLRSGGGDGGASSAAPANPVTNISGGALGYFSAHAVTRRTVIAP